MSPETYENLIKMPCEYCGLSNDVEAGAGLDRLDNNCGYVVGNVVSCCVLCNLTRADNFTPEEMRIYIGPAIAAVRRERMNVLFTDKIIGELISEPPAI